MILTATLTRKEFKKATKLFFFKKEIVKRLFGVFAIALILDAFSFREPIHIWPIDLIRFLVLFILIYFFWFIVPYWIFKNRPNAFSSLDEIKTNYEISDDSISVSSKIESQVVLWSNLKNIFSIGEFIFLELKTRRFYIIPKRSFNTEKEIYQFTRLIDNKIREHYLINSQLSGAKLYKVGWFCLIPIYGFFVGLYLTLKGFFKFRNNKLGFIGIAGVLLNLALFGFVIYHMRYSKQAENDLTELSNEDLNNVVRDIEMYKALYGSYPNKLDEVLKVDKFCPITDPFIKSGISPFDTKTNIEFCYKKVGENYTLYSVGADRTPNTADDIYPTYLDSNSFKIGLIRINR